MYIVTSDWTSAAAFCRTFQSIAKLSESRSSRRSEGKWQVLLSHRHTLSLSVCENVFESVSEAGR